MTRNPVAGDFVTILRMVRKVLRPELDPENIAQAVWVECWQHNVGPSWLRVRCRCIDALRAHARKQEQRLVEDMLPPRTEPTSGVETLDGIVRLAGLSQVEKQALWFRFYLDVTAQAAADQTGLSKEAVRLALKSAITKLKRAAITLGASK